MLIIEVTAVINMKELIKGKQDFLINKKIDKF